MILLEVIQSENIPKEGISMVYQIILMIVSAIVAASLSMIKGNLDIKKIKAENAKNNEILTERERLLTEQMRGSDNKLVTLSFDLLEITNSFQFTRKLKNSIRKISTNIIDFNVYLDDKYKYLLMWMSREFEDFALRYYTSDIKKIPHEIFSYLTIDMYSRIYKFKLGVFKYNLDEKEYLNSEGELVNITFKEYIEKSDLDKYVNELLVKLIDKDENFSKDYNTFSNQFIIVFEEFIINYFKEFIKLIDDWEDLNKFKIKENHG